MSKTVNEFKAKRITYETSLPISEVTARLDDALNKDSSGPILFELLGTVQTREELEEGIQQMGGGNDFLFFSALTFHYWRDAYHGRNDTPRLFVYVLGNPLNAETMLQHDMRASLHVPLRVLILEKADRSGTLVMYMQPSSVIATPMSGKVDERLRAAAKVLDGKAERLLQMVTST